MIKIYLIDDEPESIQILSSLIEVSCPNVQIEGKFTDPKEALIAIRNDMPDVILLDIEMPEMTGFELLRQLGKIDFEVIFVTAHNDYALNAFQLSALDYILKPVDPDELVKAIEKAEKAISQKRDARQFQIMKELLEPKNNVRKNQEQNIALPVFEGLSYHQMSSIVRVEAEKNYCNFFFDDGTDLLISKNIGTYDSSLDAYGFMRVHRSRIVNLCKVSRFIRQDGLFVEMTTSEKVEISRNKKDELLERLNKL